MADAILGLTDTESYSTRRFQSWRRAILLAFPNGSAPLTAITSLNKMEPVDDPTHNWAEKGLHQQTSAATGALNNTTDDTLTVADAIFTSGHLIKNLTESHGEVMKVVDVSADGKTLTVLRGNWGTKYATSGSTDVFGIIGNAHAEGSGSPTSLSFDPSAYYNYTQIFKTPFDTTGTAMGTPLKEDPDGPWPERGREGLERHSIEIEKALLWGVRAQYTNTTIGRAERTMGGIVSFIPSANIISGVGTLTYDLLETYMEQVFRVCLNNRQEKLMLAGSGFVRVLSKVIKNNATMNIVPKEESFGMKMYELVSAHGTIYIKTHPLMSHISQWRNDALILDVGSITTRPKRGRQTKLQRNIQLPDEDLRKDQYMTEMTLEVPHGEAHMLLKGFDTAGT